MNDYTPTTEQVREEYATRMAPHLDEARGEAFDRWLKRVQAEAWDEGFADGVNHDIGDWDNAPSIINNPYRQEQEA